jgi:hypothetical protein
VTKEKKIQELREKQRILLASIDNYETIIEELEKGLVLWDEMV